MTSGSFCSILLATCNGAAYLPSLLTSFESQTCWPVKLIFRDDGSEDATLDTLQAFRAVYPELTTILEDNHGRLGPAGNFTHLLSHADSRYVLFCDQDDVWLPDKIEKTLFAMRAAEERFGVDTPLLIHTDLCVVDSNLQLQSPSFWKYQNIEPGLGMSLNRLMPQNVVTGCTVMINRALAKLAMPIPEEAIMHDWWVALVAALFGQVIYLNESTVLYRQHGDNNVGAKQWGFKTILAKALNFDEALTSILRTMQQAQALLDQYRDSMTPKQIELVQAYAYLPSMSKTARLRAIFKYRFFKYGAIRNVGFLVNLLAINRTKQ